MNGKEIKTIFGKNIKFFRFHKEYSQADLAEKADISITFLSNIERGLKFPKPDIMAKIAKSLDIEIYDLFKTDIIHENNKEFVNLLFEDLTKKVNQVIENVYKQYSK
ncbi:MAG: helix-turn-helix domain-containing protein [Treponema sp.]|nr:helix-turn-helix domain-containing protein [Treponema sp.]